MNKPQNGEVWLCNTSVGHCRLFLIKDAWFNDAEGDHPASGDDLCIDVEGVPAGAVAHRPEGV